MEETEMGEVNFVIGNYGNFNIGDETILKGLVLELSSNGEDISVVIPTRNPGFEAKYHSELEGTVSSFYVYDIRALLENLCHSDKVIIGGGGIWSGYTGRLAKMIPIFAILSKISLKRVTFRGVGIYKTASGPERFFVNLAAMLSDGITVRDTESYDALWERVKRKAGLVDDYAVLYLRYLDRNLARYEHLLEEWPLYSQILEMASSKFVVGLSIKPTKDPSLNNHVLKVVTTFIDHVNSEYRGDVLWLLFPFAETESRIEDDRTVLDTIRERLRVRTNVLLVEQANPILWYFLIKHNVNFFVGMRYHSIVFSWIARKPFFGIAYENKNINLFNQLGHKEWDTIDGITPSRLISSFENHFR
ncbi:polysaccharide pyruvyl transferase family protein [Thermococcus sp. MV11]|uniref:polysaccharide pyruvyl transferase family protein n=1 Tax=Thermococcus sp. MV11 TaxID=1638267 RepID=UPI0014303F05